MNYMIYAKHNQKEKRYSPMDLHEGTNKNKLVFATIISDKERAIGYADKLTAACTEYSFQVRIAGKATVVYKPTLNTNEQMKFVE